MSEFREAYGVRRLAAAFERASFIREREQIRSKRDCVLRLCG